MSFKHLALATIAIASLTACSSGNKPQTFSPSAQEEGTSEEVGSYQAGTPLYTFNVDHGQIMIDNANVDAIDDAALDGYPALLNHSKAIGTVDRAIETNGNTLELYAGDTMLMAFDTREDTERLLWSKDASFKAESARVTYLRGEAGEKVQSPVNGEVTFVLNECKVAEQGKEEQQQEESKQEEEQTKEQGKFLRLAGAPEEQGKQEQEATPAPECKEVSIRLNLRQEEQKQEQEQAKEEKQQEEQQQPDQEKGQGKEQPQERGQQLRSL